MSHPVLVKSSPSSIPGFKISIKAKESEIMMMMMMTKKLALNHRVLTVRKWTWLQAHLVSRTDKKGQA
ncbi:hypothetical protein DPMN_131584 [Dreissena polymorpha]|uniref:Uncharacterized protein n=1 Tax=Dreissena polymorpha TaxID=45954 RepID=A0A9D4FS85_DREPO|nr:hypothetical protein DPMN_131584 [Dreissena polymorpha]